MVIPRMRPRAISPFPVAQLPEASTPEGEDSSASVLTLCDNITTFFPASASTTPGTDPFCVPPWPSSHIPSPKVKTSPSFLHDHRYLGESAPRRVAALGTALFTASPTPPRWQ
jgi:hypothetical protein